MRRFAADGHSVMLVGRTGPGASAALAGAAPDRTSAVVMVESAVDVDRHRVAPDRVSYVVGAGADVEHAVRLAGALRARYPRIRAQHPDELCYAATDRAETVRSIRHHSDVVLLLGDDATPVRTAAGTTRMHRIAAAADIRPDWLAGAGTVGLVNTTPDPHPTQEIIRALSGLGPLSVARRRVTTEVVKDW